MRVAHLTTVDLSLRYLLLPQLTAVVDLGSEAIGISASGPHVADLEARGIHHISLPGATRSVAPVADVTAMFSLWRILRDERPDVIHTHTPKPGLYGRVIGRIAGVPAVLNTVHGLYATPDDRIAKRAIVYTLEAFAARFSDLELVQSAEDFRFMTKRHITRPERTVFLGNGVDLTRFDPDLGSAGERRSTRAILGVDDEQILVGVVGRLVAEKGFLELFDAVQDLDDQYRLVVIGPHEPDKNDAIGAATVAGARAAGVRFLGLRDDVDVLYRAMDLFVLPSHREGFPRAAMEAAASGLPLIVTDVRGCREVVDDGVNGLLVPVRDAHALRSAIETLGSDVEMRQRMGEAGRAKSVREFDEQRVVHRVIESQIRVLREKGRFDNFDDHEYSIRPAELRDARIIAQIQAGNARDSIRGIGRITRAYRRLIPANEGVVLVAEDAYGPFAYAAGVGSGDGGLPIRPLRPRSYRSLDISLPFRWKSRKLRQNPSPDDHVELLSLRIANAFKDSGADAALAKAFLQTAATLGATSVRTTAELGDLDTIEMLKSAGFTSDLSTSRDNRITNLWAPTD